MLAGPKRIAFDKDMSRTLRVESILTVPLALKIIEETAVAGGPDNIVMLG